jgi:hypothetical protein
MILRVLRKLSCWTVVRTIAVASDKKLVSHYFRLNEEFKATIGDSRSRRLVFATQAEVAKELWRRGLYPSLPQAITHRPDSNFIGSHKENVFSQESFGSGLI